MTVTDLDTGPNDVDVYSSGTWVSVIIPENAEGNVSVTTPGGTSNSLSVGPSTFSAIEAVADVGVPVDAGQPSVNVGQLLTIRGTGLGPNANVLFPTKDDNGVAGTVATRVSGANADRTVATVRVPNGAVTGNVVVAGATGSISLQIVPRIDFFSLGTFTPGNNLRLDGAGFAEGMQTVRFGNVLVADPDTGPNTVDVFWSGTATNVTIPNNPGSRMRIVTDGGTSNVIDVAPAPEDLIAPAPNPQQVPTTGPRTFRSPAGDYSTLVENADGTFTRRMKDGTEITFDAAGRQTAVTDRNDNVTASAYDGNGLLTRITDPVGLETTLTYQNGHLGSITDPANRTTSFLHDTQGNLIRITDPDNTTRQFGYDADHRMTSQISKRSFRTTYEYNFAGRHVKSNWPDESMRQIAASQLVGLPDLAGGVGTVGNPAPVVRPEEVEASFTDGEGRQTTFEMDRFGEGTRITDAAGLVTEIERDEDGNPTKISLPSGAIFDFEYDEKGNRLSFTDRTLNSSTRYTYDGNFSQVSSITDAFNETTAIQIDGSGNSRSITSPLNRAFNFEYDSQGLLTKFIDPNNATSVSTYDGQGRLQQVTWGANAPKRSASLTYTFAGQIQTLTDPANREYSFEYDSLGRLTKETLPGNRPIVYAYDSDGNLASIAPPGRPAHNFKYDSRGLMTEYVPPPVNNAGTVKTVYTYDDAGEMSKVTRPDGKEITYGYDSAGRLSTIDIPRGTITYGYSPTTGQLATASAPDGVNLAYEFNGELLAKFTWSGPGAGSVSFSYDANYRMASLAVNNDTITYEYDKDDALTKAGNIALVYNSTSGLLSSTTLGVVSDLLNFNNHGELSSYSASVNSTAVYSTTYTRDQLGRILSKTEGIDGSVTTVSYAYDDAGRLIEEAQNGTTVATYEYDANGNRLTYRDASGTVVNGSYDDQDRLLQYGNSTFAYTANGELDTKTVSGQVTDYTYDVFSNLTSVTLPNGTQIKYFVDNEGRRIAKAINGTTSSAWLYKDDLNPVAEFDRSGNLVSRFIYASRINVPDYMVKQGATYRILSDHLGSVRLVVNTQTGAIAQRLDYDAFGRITADTNPGFQPFGFAGGFYDPDTGLVRFGARDYDSEIGRWTTKDPAGFEGGVNLYTYVDNDPVNVIDPEGELAFLIPILAGAAGGAAIDIGLQLLLNGGNFSCIDWGQVALSAGLGALGGGALKAYSAGWRLSGGLYKHGGGGLNVLKNGTRKFGVDWHKFKVNGKWVNRPHYHRGATKNQIKKHRPWQGGW